MIKSTLSLAITLAIAAPATAQDAAEASGAVSPGIEEISVIGRFVPDEKRNTSALSNVLSAEQFSRSGDTNIAEGLKRVAGLSLVGGKYVYVRGLGERYSSALLNGSTMSSPEPLNRVVPLDLFPSAVMDSVVVQKTYSAQFPSEFGGGVLQMRTRKSSDGFFLNLSSSLGATSGSSFRSGLRADGGSRDWLGYDDGGRDLPDLLEQATANGQRLQRRSPYLDTGGYTAAELQAVGRSLDSAYDLKQKSVPADVGLTASAGNSHEFGQRRFSYLAALDYKNGWDRKEIERNSYKSGVGDELVRENAFTFFNTTNEVDISTILTTSLEISSDHNLQATSLLLRQTDDAAGELEGFFGDERLDSRITEIEYIEREIRSHQLQGEHYFPALNEFTVSWRYNLATADRDAPDTRRYRYDLVNGNYRFNLRSDGNVRRFSELNDENKDYAVDLSMAFYPMTTTLIVSGGYNSQENARDYEIRRFTFFELGDVANNPGFLNQSLSQVLTPENISPDGFELRETTRPTDTYAAHRNLEAYYLQADLNIADHVQLLAGVRREDYRQAVNTYDLFRPERTIEARIESGDLLPSLTATYIVGNHQFRAGYSETTSRPDFRELSPAAFTNPLTGHEVVGNPDLQVASIENYDLRWEWYFGAGDNMSAGLFQKDFDSPIEMVVQPGANNARSYINAESAVNRGVEVELRKQLDFLGPRWADFYLAGNASFIESEVSISPTDRSILTHASRPLQGQSDWLFNAELGFDGYDGLTATLLYHYAGDRIYEVGILGAPDLIEEGRGTLDLVLQKVINHWKMSFKAQNLMDESHDITQGGLISNAYQSGRSVTAKLEYRF